MIQKKTRIRGTVAALLLATITTLAAAQEKYSLKVIPQLDRDSQFVYMNNIGSVVGSSPGNEAYLYRPGLGVTVVGDKLMRATGINVHNDVVGFNTINQYSGSKYFLFYVPENGSTQTLEILEQEYNEPIGIYINDNRGVATIGGRNIKFYNQSSLINTVTLEDKYDFDGYIPNAVLTLDGDLIVRMSNVGSASWYRITSSGTITQISTSAMPADSSLIKLLSNGKGVLRTSTDHISITDFSTAATSLIDLIPGKNNGAGKKLEPTLVNVSLDSIARPVDSQFLKNTTTDSNSFLVPNDGNGQELACASNMSKKYLLSDAFDIADNGSVLVQVIRKTASYPYDVSSYAVLEPDSNGQKLQDNCVRMQAKMVGSCAEKYFKNDGITVKRSIPANTRCSIEVKLKTPNQKPLSGGRIVTGGSYDRTYRGKTGTNGVLRFNFGVGSYPYSIKVIAPYGDKKTLSRYNDIYFTK